MTKDDMIEGVDRTKSSDWLTLTPEELYTRDGEKYLFEKTLNLQHQIELIAKICRQQDEELKKAQEQLKRINMLNEKIIPTGSTHAMFIEVNKSITSLKTSVNQRIDWIDRELSHMRKPSKFRRILNRFKRIFKRVLRKLGIKS